MVASEGNLFADIPSSLPAEVFQVLVAGRDWRLERIISQGQATPEGQWYDQEWDEWVVLVAGAAGLYFEGEEGVRELMPGDFVQIPAHCRHRVEWTDRKETTIWLALHYAK